LQLSRIPTLFDRSGMIWLRGVKHFIIGANVADSMTTGMGRQMHGLGDALVAKGHRVDYLFEKQLKSRVGRRLSRLESPIRAAMHVRRLATKSGSVPIAILHEPIGWATALFLRRRVRTLAMVHNCESKCWKIQLDTRAATGERIALSSRIVWPLTELLQADATLKTADGVLCLSSEDLIFIRDRLRVPAHRIKRIDNGLEPSFIGLPFPEGPRERDILFLGSWLPRKGIRVLVKALEELSNDGMAAKVTLAGTGASREEILRALPEVWRAVVEVIPYVPPERLISIYQRHRIFVLPSITEGIPLSLLEAMACGLCPIVTNVGGVSDVITDGKEGTLVPALDAAKLAHAISVALGRTNETIQLARNAQARMQSYGWNRVAEQVETFDGSITR
jgi:glycosyltransferase involved in cell wall biosynthesis